MNLSWIDWAVVFGTAIFFIVLAFSAKKYSRSTADFLAANRCVGRYLLTIAEGVTGLGAVSMIGSWQVIFASGFASNWWNTLAIPVSMIMMMSGWVIYRYRETRVLTMAQFFEIRYSRNFRIFAGIVCWLSGILNFGIFPAVSANFFISYCNLPQYYQFAGVALPMYQTLIVVLVGMALYFTFIGGQISILITDFFQSFFCNIVLVAILVILLVKFPLRDVFDSFMTAEKGKSMVNPLGAGQADFSPWYFIIAIFGTVFNRLSWQGNQAFNCSAKSPHEAKMAGVISGFRSWGFLCAIMLIPLVGYMMMHHPKYSAYGEQIRQMISSIPNAEVRDQMLVPMTMTLYLPVGLIGAFAAVVLAASVSTFAIYLHSWGTIFVQDIVLPLRKKTFSNKQHMMVLRLSILFVGIFICVFSSLFRQTQHIFYFFALTAAIWLGGVGSVIIGGLYTRWGNTLGAYAALTIGSLLATGGIICDQMWVSWYGKNFILNGQEIYFYAMLIAAGSYVLCSLLGKREIFNLEKMLHRGQYKITSEHATCEAGTPIDVHGKFGLKKLLGITKEFTLGDKTIYGISVFYTLMLLVLFAVLTSIAYLWGVSDTQWRNYHYYMMIFTISTSFIIAVWLSIGGIRDVIFFVRDLRAVKQDFTDDGSVTDHEYHKDVQNCETLNK